MQRKYHNPIATGILVGLIFGVPWAIGVIWIIGNVIEGATR